jgi:ABC-type Mn2+/Zn2+ transport system ATPase subunit
VKQPQRMMVSTSSMRRQGTILTISHDLEHVSDEAQYLVELRFIPVGEDMYLMQHIWKSYS